MRFLVRWPMQRRVAKGDRREMAHSGSEVERQIRAAWARREPMPREVHTLWFVDRPILRDYPGVQVRQIWRSGEAAGATAEDWQRVPRFCSLPGVWAMLTDDSHIQVAP